MSDVFPTSKIDALTMLYLEQQDLSGLSPETLLDRYDEVYKKLMDYNNKKNPIDYDFC
jgi:hypothetical protein